MTPARNSRRPARLLASLAAAALIGAAGAALANPEQAVRDIESTRTLIEKSKSAAQIEATRTPESLARREEARALLREAEIASSRGDFAATTRLLTESKKKFFEAVRAANPEGVKSDKARIDYDNRLASVRVLRDALGRLGGARNAAVVAEVDAAIRDSEALAGRGQHAAALVALDKGYAAVKSANVEQRDHTEQVASKNFANKEEEYRYELGRNDDYAALSQGVLPGLSPQMQPMFKPVVERGDALRKTALEAAANKDWNTAVTMLENSTAEFKKVIRAAGVPVP